MITAYHFVGDTLRDGRPVPPDGEWLEHIGPLEMCKSGLHGSRDPCDALMYAIGHVLCLVDLNGDVIEDTDKLVARRRRIVRRIDATDLLRRFARECALSVVHLWDCPDIVRRYLETGDESIRAAASAAASTAVSAAAWDAVRAAAWDAARAAASAAARAAASTAASAAAWDAVSAAAWDAARAAASVAASVAASAAASAAQRCTFRALVNEAFEL